MVASFVVPLVVSLSALLLVVLSCFQQFTSLTMTHDALYPPPFTLTALVNFSLLSALLLPLPHNQFRPSPLPSIFPSFPSSWQLPFSSTSCRDNISSFLSNVTTFLPTSDLCPNTTSPPPPPFTPQLPRRRPRRPE